MSEMRCRFVLLKYSPTVRSEVEAPCLVVAHIYPWGSEESGLLQIVEPEKWPILISEEHRDYIAQLIEDWEQVGPSHMPVLFEQLCQLSIGPLRTAGEGRCPPEQVESIASKFFTEYFHINEVPPRSS
jgi:hypothetical protein